MKRSRLFLFVAMLCTMASIAGLNRSIDLEQHKYGPFGPIRAKAEELAAASHTANAGERDNGSGASERARSPTMTKSTSEAA